MRIVIVGGGGYIGYHIGAQLVFQNEHSVLLLDIVSPNLKWIDRIGCTCEQISEQNLNSDATNTKGQLTFFNASILDLDRLKSAFHGAQCVIQCGNTFCMYRVLFFVEIYMNAYKKVFYWVQLQAAFGIFMTVSQCNAEVVMV